jgi:hypothetical protein
MTITKKSGSVSAAELIARQSPGRVTARQEIADQEKRPEFRDNHARLRAERLAREAAEKAK